MKKLFITAILLGTFSLGYAQSDYYNDYRRSVTDVNWQSVVSDLLLSPTQANEINNLNSRYNDYDGWNRVYANQPDRWSTDRYSELERIMGRDKYTKFKTKYYKGKNPVAVYNSNKNNDKRYKHINKKAKVYKVKKAKGNR
ncbi:hypothetical protein ASG31_09175 [Chryseobacterium sp. Leaf404]|uniref:hypothetical protein n=1 Tax=unclassified Chryseobacterium TaxID=2593645 RepID=UPI0006F727E8|nr:MULTISPECIES: hypothetical protein [unclassified Chryseobacterium]KQT17562.1 hypothetical protein ASG31_09175 [Chryseobacterium sp. Leaf404]